MSWDKRKAKRVQFKPSTSIDIRIVGTDGLWRRDGKLLDISESGVLLSHTESVQGLDLRTFLLEFKPQGMASRLCAVVRIEAGRIAARFVKEKSR
ncbi:PilZ domain-containing protein [Rhodopseudomonas palustris]|uniref:PilZ domain-containing protein n=1 Tax=Rhodopseudomonas palustris TaxID=1076 RepID=A0A323UH62_RHOPL|nr:PilZ domain-containing protein [Rhodopseudomonas palustris]PZA10870.1 PilZ domain-containing protein [Rhodopseudomonas palustris]